MKQLITLLIFFNIIFISNGQNFMIFNSIDKSSDIPNAYPYIFTPGNNNFTVDTSSISPYIITATGNAPNAQYYINGIGVTNYGASKVVESINYNTANFLNDKFVMNLKSSTNDEMRIIVRLITYNNGSMSDVYGYEFILPGSNNFIEVFVNLKLFSLIDNGYLPNNTDYINSSIAEKISKVELEISKHGNLGTGVGTIQFKDIYFGTPNPVSTSTISSANIGSTVLFPNPAENVFTAQVNLKSSANVSITVSDMMGNVVKTEELGNVVSASKEINVAGLAKGMYTVTYILDGAPAKAEKIMVK